MTFEEFERLPEHVGRQELLDGELIELPPPDFSRRRISNGLAVQLHDWVAGQHSQRTAAYVGKVYHCMGYWLRPHSWVVPDVSVTPSCQPAGTYVDRAPLVAIEIASEEVLAVHLDAKLGIYRAAGTEEVWTIYPDTGRIWMHRSNHAELKPLRFTSEILEGAEIDLEPLLKR